LVTGPDFPSNRPTPLLNDAIANGAPDGGFRKGGSPRIVFHDVPQDGHGAYFDQRFWGILRVILEPHTKATAKQYDFHNNYPF
jgi:hypothetical protein